MLNLVSNSAVELLPILSPVLKAHFTLFNLQTILFKVSLLNASKLQAEPYVDEFTEIKKTDFGGKLDDF